MEGEEWEEEQSAGRPAGGFARSRQFSRLVSAAMLENTAVGEFVEVAADLVPSGGTSKVAEGSLRVERYVCCIALMLPSSCRSRCECSQYVSVICVH